MSCLPLRSRLFVFVAAFGGLVFSGGAAASCRQVSCSNHGTCFAENGTPHCLCDEGFHASGTSCVPLEDEVSASRVDSEIGVRIAALARAEVGRDLRAVGMSGARRTPGPLSRYITPETLWCSDFVAWAYARAQVPLSGGYIDGWLIPTNRALRAWFQQRGRWISQEHARRIAFEPLPGDFVRIRTARWGHSAIVERVEGDTLHVLEGNAGGRVHANRYRGWQHHIKIDGFGLVPNATERSVWIPTMAASLWAQLRHR